MTALSGKNVLVIGGSSGIGYATAAGALAEGANVTIASRSEEKLRAAQASLQGRVEARKTLLENAAKALPVKRVGQAQDCADQILLMLRNTFMTGSVVYVDGGGLLI